MSTERKIINGLLVFCLGLGFVVLLTIHLPQQLDAMPPVQRQETPAVLEPAPTPAAVPTSAATASKAQPAAQQKPAIIRPHAEVQSPESTELLTPAVELDLPTPIVSPNERRFRVSSLARNEDRSAKRPAWMQVPPELKAEVAFWRDIYAKYTSDEIVLHNPDDLSVVYGVVDVRDIMNDKNLTDVEKARLREQRIEQRRDEIKLARGVDRVRGQSGLRDKFIKGLQFSGRYLGEIEAIFEAQGVPREISRLVFVESMFNLEANSSVGAAGIWQFMRSSAAHYRLKNNEVLDERRDPIAATYAAIRLLKDNYAMLGTWPLAINAYNSGRGRLSQAVNQLGTTNIATIIRRFQNPAYGFASRNFYPCFLAAFEVAEQHARHFGPIAFDPPLHYETVALQQPASLPRVAQMANVSLAQMMAINPELNRAAWTGRVTVPAGREIKVPHGHGQQFAVMVARASRSQPTHISHVVSDGETLASIARQYGVTKSVLRNSNKNIADTPTPGSTVVVPTKM